MRVSRFMRVLTSGLLLLLLLATDGATDDFTTACSSELIACQNDETCVSCFSTASENGEEVSDCIEEYGLDEITSSTVTCTDYMDLVCCYDQGAEEECLENSAFEEYWLCALEENSGCMHDEITCSGASPSIGDDSTSACSSELIACQNDETCVSCFSTASENGEEVSDCIEEYGLDEITSSTVTCSDYMDLVCCYDEVAEEACLDNAAFEEFWHCFLEETYGCTDDEITCS